MEKCLNENYRTNACNTLRHNSQSDKHIKHSPNETAALRLIL